MDLKSAAKSIILIMDTGKKLALITSVATLHFWLHFALNFINLIACGFALPLALYCHSEHQPDLILAYACEKVLLA